MTEIIKVLGPPGTGKTTTLLNYVEDAMESIDIKKIGYFSFTRKAAEEARDRAVTKFKLDKKVEQLCKKNSSKRLVIRLVLICLVLIPKQVYQKTFI